MNFRAYPRFPPSLYPPPLYFTDNLVEEDKSIVSMLSSVEENLDEGEYVWNPLDPQLRHNTKE